MGRSITILSTSKCNCIVRYLDVSTNIQGVGTDVKEHITSCFIVYCVRYIVVNVSSCTNIDCKCRTCRTCNGEKSTV